MVLFTSRTPPCASCVCHPAFLSCLKSALPQRSWLLFRIGPPVTAVHVVCSRERSPPPLLGAAYARLAVGHTFPQAHSYARHRLLVHVYPSFTSSMIDGPKFSLAQSQRFKALCLGPVVAPRRRAFPRATPRPRRLRWPLPRCIRRLHLFFPSPFLTAPSSPRGCFDRPDRSCRAAPLPSRLLYLHRSMPPLRPSIGLHLASFSRFIYACCLFDLMCCARLPSFSTPSPRCRTALAGRMHQG
jgi:hypothetical protein